VECAPSSEVIRCHDCNRTLEIPAGVGDDELTLLVRRFLAAHETCCFTVTLDVPIVRS
jgi:hypothetical protein